MTSLVKAIQERLAKICEGRHAGHEYTSHDATIAMESRLCASAIRAADLSDLEPKERATPRTKALKRKWSAREGASNSACSQESHEIYMLAEDFEGQLAALTASLEAKEVECARLRLPPEMTLSDHPGCAFCMEASTPVRLGEVCPKCGDRLPTKREHELKAECEALRRDAERYRWLRLRLPKQVEEWTLTRLAAGIPEGDKHIDAAIDAAKDSHE